MGIVEATVIALVFTLAPATLVVMLKGRWTLVIAGCCLLFPLLWYGAFALANPSSWWARRFYDEEKLRKAQRYQSRWSRTFAD